jgi:phosphatidylinositol 3-kinase
MHEETFYPTPQQGASGAVTPHDLAVYRKQSALKKESDDLKSFNPMELVTVMDYEDEHDNPVEDKYRALAHDLLRGLVDPALKPDRKQRDRLAAIIDSTSHHLTREEKDLLWRFRFSLVDDRRALTKFLLAVDWTVESEVVQAAELLEQWRKRSPIEVTDALKLLGKHVAFQTNLVRSYAIDTLEAAPDTELRLYLLQLVQALKYENTEIPDPAAILRSGVISSPNSPVSSLATFLINRAAGNIGLANFLYW